MNYFHTVNSTGNKQMSSQLKKRELLYSSTIIGLSAVVLLADRVEDILDTRMVITTPKTFRNAKPQILNSAQELCIPLYNPYLCYLSAISVHDKNLKFVSYVLTTEPLYQLQITIIFFRMFSRK